MTAWGLTNPPRPWQEQAHQLWLRRGLRGIAGVVTGAGKTTFAQMCLLSFRGAFDEGRCLVIVPTIALLDQWYVSLQEDLGVSADDVAVFSGESKPPSGRLINLMVLNTARTMAVAVADGHPLFAIVDECHRIASPANLMALEVETVASLGISATPEREYDSWLDEHVVPHLGPVFFRYTYEEARRDGVISPFELRNIEIPLTAIEREQFDKLTFRIRILLRRQSQGEEVDELLKRVLLQRARVSSSARMRVPVSVRILDDHRGQRTILFHESIAAADELLNELRNRGHRATIYHSRIAPPVRRDNLRLYRAGVFDILITCRALDEGVNVPDTEIAVISSSTASTRQRVQRLGRVLRPAPGKVAVVYTLFASEAERHRLTIEAEEGTGADAIRWLRSTGPSV